MSSPQRSLCQEKEKQKSQLNAGMRKEDPCGTCKKQPIAAQSTGDFKNQGFHSSGRATGCGGIPRNSQDQNYEVII
ncbi:hypothetical protein LEMLEM_LOCUS7398 [Lemmus lemmus]